MNPNFGITFTGDVTVVHAMTGEQFHLNEQIRIIQARHMAELKPYYDRLTALAMTTAPLIYMKKNTDGL